MVKGRILEAVKFLEKSLRDGGGHIRKIILFGSHAHGTGREDSDVDVVIVSEDFRNKDIFERALLTKEAEVMTLKKFMIPFDIITLTPEEFEEGNSLIVDYAQKGIVVA